MAPRRKRIGRAVKSSTRPKRKRSLKPKKDAPTAIALLKSDHREVERMFAQFEKATGTARKRTIVDNICEALTVHMTIEEQIFYPQARNALKRAGEDLLDEAEVEHEGIKWRIDLLKKMKSEDDLFDAEVTVLQEYVRHHVKEEERYLFPRLRLSKFDNTSVGEKLAAKKEAMTGKPVKAAPSLFERGIDALVGPSPGTI